MLILLLICTALVAIVSWRFVTWFLHLVCTMHSGCSEVIICKVGAFMKFAEAAGSSSLCAGEPRYPAIDLSISIINAFPPVVSKTPYCFIASQHAIVLPARDFDSKPRAHDIKVTCQRSGSLDSLCTDSPASYIHLCSTKHYTQCS